MTATALPTLLEFTPRRPLRDGKASNVLRSEGFLGISLGYSWKGLAG